MLIFKHLIACVVLNNALTAITATATIPQFSHSKDSKESKESKESKSNKSGTVETILEPPLKSKSKSSKSKSSKSQSRDLHYGEAAHDIRLDIIKRINNASNSKKKSRGILSHAYFIDSALTHSDCNNTNSPDTCHYDPALDRGDKLNKLLLNAYRTTGPTHGKGIEWNKPDGTYFGTVTDSTAPGYDGDLNIVTDYGNGDGNDCIPDGFIQVNVTVDNKTTLEIRPPDNIQCEYRQDDYRDGICLYRPYSGSYTNLRDDLLPIVYSDYNIHIIPVGFFVAFDEGGSTDKANPYMTIVDGDSNDRYGNFISNQDPFLCTLQDQYNLTILNKTSGRDLAAAGDPKFKHYCEIDCGKGGCGGPVDDNSLRYDYKINNDTLPKNKDEGPIVEKNGQPISYVGSNGTGWYDMFINKPCLVADATNTTCRNIDFRQCNWVRDSASEKLTGDRNKVYNAWLKAKQVFEERFTALGLDYNTTQSFTALEQILMFTPHAPFNVTSGNFSEYSYKPLSDKYKDNRPKFYYEPSLVAEHFGEGLILENEVPIYMDRLKDAKRLDAPYQRYERGPKAFGDDFLAVYANLGSCDEQLGIDAPAFCDEGVFGGIFGNAPYGTINDVLHNNDTATSWYEQTKSTACWTADQISRELGRFVPVMGFKSLNGQITPGSLNQWRNENLTDPEYYINHIVNCCDIFMRNNTLTDEDISNGTTFFQHINDNEYYKMGKHRVKCYP